MATLLRWIPLRRDLGLQLLALYLLFVGPVIAAALVFDSLAGARLQRDVKAADLALARSIALETDAALQNALGTVAQLSQAPQVQSGDIDALAPLFAAVSSARSEINLVYLLDSKGIMRYHYPEGPGTTVGTDFSFREYFQDARNSQAPLMSAGRVSPTTGQPVSTAVMPIRNSRGEFLGLVGTNLALEHLSATLEQIGSDPDTGLRVSILDASGQIVADSNAGRLLTQAGGDLQLVARAALRGESNSHVGADSAGREWLHGYVPIPSAGWAVIVQRPTDIAFASPRAFHNGLLVAIGIFLVGGLFFWMMLSRRVIAPLERLATFSVSIGERTVAPGDRAHLAGLSSRPDQMGHLIRALTRMEQDVERRFTELATLLDTSTAVVSSLDTARVLDLLLEQVQRLLHVDACAVVALDERAGELRLRASRGLSPEYVRHVRTRSVPAEPNSPSMTAIRTGRPVLVGDTETERDSPGALRDRARAEGYRALAAVPLSAPHAPPSTLVLYWRLPHDCPPDEVNLIVNFANHASMAVENAALFALTDDKLREQTRTLEAIVQSLNDGLILESPDGRILYCNRRIGELADVSPLDIVSQTASDLRARLLSRANPSLDGFSSAPDGRPDPEISLRLNGRTLDLRLQSFDVTDDHGQLIGRGQLWVDVTGDKELDRMKSSLIATVSHELRTPLAAIKGNITSLLADDVQWDAVSQREFLQVASNETDRLSMLVSDLLDLSKIQAGTFDVSRRPCELPRLAARAISRVSPAPGERLRLEFPDDLPPVQADPPRIEAVFRNLVENAVKYSPPGAPIRVTAERSNGHVLVRVADDGRGIPPEHRDKVFDRFYRVDTGLARQAGAGLGLAICKGFVEAHGGRIWVEPSERGTVFAFTLPVI